MRLWYEEGITRRRGNAIWPTSCMLKTLSSEGVVNVHWNGIDRFLCSTFCTLVCFFIYWTFGFFPVYWTAISSSYKLTPQSSDPLESVEGFEDPMTMTMAMTMKIKVWSHFKKHMETQVQCSESGNREKFGKTIQL